MKQTINILLSGVGGPTPRSIARSLLFHTDLDVRIIGTDVNPYAHGLYEDDLYAETYIIPSAGEPGYWDALERIVEKHAIDLAIVQPEQEVLAWAKRKEAGEPWPCKTMLPSLPIVQNLLDKSLMTTLLESTDLVPNSLNIDPTNIDLEEIEATLGFPFWIRATSGSSGLGSLKVEDESSLRYWITINPTVKQFIGSAYLPGRNLACKLLFENGKLLRSASGERVQYIMSKVAPSGITGNTSFGRLLNEPELVRLSEKALRIIADHSGTELHGMFTADFKEDQHGKPYVTEINVRMVAFNLSFAAGGANFSEAIVKLLMEPDAFDREYQMFEFEKDLIFLRDVDADPILIKETELKQKGQI